MAGFKNLAALSLSLAGVAGAEADYRIGPMGRVHEVGRPRRGACCNQGPVAPAGIPTNLGVMSFTPFMPQPACCGGAARPVSVIAPQPMLVPPPPSACGPSGVPVVQLPQQIVTYQDVARTEIRREAVTVNVPVTTYKQITVDEGSYQSVWVPRQVTKSVPETVIQQHVQYRDVPVSTVYRVPHQQTVLASQPTMQISAGGLYVPSPAPIVTPQAGMLGALPGETLPTITVPTPPASEQPTRMGTLPESSKGGLEWQPVKPRGGQPQTSSLETNSSRAKGKFSRVTAPRSHDDIQTAMNELRSR